MVMMLVNNYFLFMFLDYSSLPSSNYCLYLVKWVIESSRCYLTFEISSFDLLKMYRILIFFSFISKFKV